MKLALGVVGEKGSGKGTFIRILTEIAVGRSVERIPSSEVLGETLDLWDIPRTRRALQDLAIIMNNHFGDTTLTHAVQHRMKKSKADIVIFDGMRWLKDLEMMRSFENSLIIYVTTDVEKRYERTKLRNEKMDEGQVTFEQFMEEEKVKTELDIKKIAAQAEIAIVNDGDMESYRREIEKAYKNQILPRLS
jgi:dephospho-CoA kinase